MKDNVAKPDFAKIAAALARRGFHVFPLGVNSKEPAIKGFPTRATADQAQIDTWAKNGPHRNVGVSTTASAHGPLLAVDVDDKDGRNGSETILRLEMEGFDLPPTFTVETPNGGLHYYFTVPAAMKQGVDVLGSGVDTRSKGGYVAGPGSIVNGGGYEIVNDLPVAAAPRWLLDRLQRAPEGEAKAGERLDGINAARARRRAIEWLQLYAPVGTAGNRNDTAFVVAARLKDFGCEPEEVLELMESHWECDPPAPAEDLEKIIRNAFKYAREAQGSADPGAAFAGAAGEAAGAGEGSTGQDSSGGGADGGDDGAAAFWDNVEAENAEAAREEAEKFHKKEDMTDVGHANKLRRITKGNLRYVFQSKQWIYWDGGRWRPDVSGSEAQRAAIDVSRYLAKAIKDAQKKADDPQFKAQKPELLYLIESLDKALKNARSKTSLTNMQDIAKKLPGIEISQVALDTNPELLGVQNGVVNLRKGEMCPISRDEYVTKHTAVAFNPEAKAPLWESFVAHITGEPLPPEFDADGEVIPETVGRYKPREDLARHLQKKVGYCMTGLTVEQVLFFEIGDGANGKSVFWEIILHIAGDYGVRISSEILMESKRETDAEAATPSKARLAGARIAVSSEVDENAKLDSKNVKNLTGDSTMDARFLYGPKFTFTISHKHVVLANSAPPLNHMDSAAKGRFQFNPYDCRWNRPTEERNALLPNGDKELAQKLRNEAEGILAWCIRGAVLYFKEGLEPPEAVREMTQNYLGAQDPVGRWVKTLAPCAFADGYTAGELFPHFEGWLKAQGLMKDSFDRPKGAPSSDALLGKALKAAGYVSKKDGNGAMRYQLRPKEDA
jgi:P4 family phage/plasmid primase-like protien